MSKYHSVNTAIIGMAGMGKTTLAKNLLKNYPIIFIYDPSDEFPAIPYFDGKHIRRVQRITEEDLEILPQIFLIPRIREVKKLILLDDADELLADNSKDNPVVHLFRYSRNYNLDIIYTVKRLAFINTNVRHNTQRLYIFKINRLFIRELINAWKFPPEFAHEVVNLKKGEFIRVEL